MYVSMCIICILYMKLTQHLLLCHIDIILNKLWALAFSLTNCLARWLIKGGCSPKCSLAAASWASPSALEAVPRRRSARN